MKIFLLIFLLTTLQSFAFTHIATCKGLLLIDDTPVEATIFSDKNEGIIVLSIGVGHDLERIASKATISEVNNSLRVYDNNFSMDFILKGNRPTKNIDAYRDGMFFVDEFTCFKL